MSRQLIDDLVTARAQSDPNSVFAFTPDELAEARTRLHTLMVEHYPQIIRALLFEAKANEAEQARLRAAGKTA